MRSWTFWLLLGEKSLGAGLAAAAGVLISNAAKTLGSVPWYGVLSTALITALATAMLGLSSELKDGALPTSFIPATPTAMKTIGRYARQWSARQLRRQG